MPDTTSDIIAPADARSISRLLRQLQESGQPATLTINGQAQLIVRDSASLRRLIDLAERVEEFESLRVAVEEMEAGKFVPVEDMLAEMRQILEEVKTR